MATGMHPQSENTSRNPVFALAQCVSWVVVLISISSSCLHMISVRSFLAEVNAGNVLGYCGNIVTHPLGVILNIQAPMVAAALSGLFLAARQTRSSTCAFATIVGACAAGLIFVLVSGHHFYAESLADSRGFFEAVWWLKPLAWLWS